MSIKHWRLGWKRCDCVKCEAALTIEQTEEDCGWVMWEDHKEEATRLKAENERLRNLAIKLDGYVDLVRHENERLRKAVKIADGAVDCIIQVHDYGFKVSTSYVERLKREWYAAKEGKQP